MVASAPCTEFTRRDRQYCGVMAQTTVITDDIDGSANAETIQFGFNGTEYTIDLARKNKAALEKALKPYIGVATKVSTRRSSTGSSSRRGRRSGTTRDGSSVDLAAVRAWAAEHSIEVSSRGRVAADVLNAYTAAQ